VFVAASTECFPHLSLEAALTRLGDLEYTRAEIGIRPGSPHLTPETVAADPEGALHIVRDSHRLTLVALTMDSTAKGAAYYEQFTACAKLAKATKMVSITVPAAELGTPFNAEVERLRELTRIGGIEGVLVSIKTEVGRVSQDPDTALALCKAVKGLGVTLDPSHYVCGPHQGGNYDQLLPYVYHVQLRDSTKDKFQVRVGQGSIEYGRLITQLARFNYNRALSVLISPEPDIDHDTEMRKLRLLLESLV
jgi:sugar phosphate isomerase/epimerase